MTQEIKIRITGDASQFGTAATQAQASILGVDGAAKGLKGSLQGLDSGTTATARGVESIGISAKQTSAALRGVPAQFTDIVTSLQGGQAPITVFTQQFGQLKDMFGGTAPALKAMGGYVLGLVNPFTLAAAAAATTAYAISNAEQEMQKINRSLVMTGGYAGKTAGEISAMARGFDGATFGKAAEVLAEVAGSGEIAGDSLARVSKIAIDLEKNGVQAVAATVKEFAELGKSPVDASERLNEKYRYLTGAVYEQIKALKDQGREQEAGVLAQKAFADAVESRIPRLVGNIGTIESAWRKVTGAIKGAADAVLDVGRVNPLRDATVDKQTAQGKLASLRNLPDGTDTRRAIAEQEKVLAVAEARLATLERVQDAEKKGAVAVAQAARQGEAQIVWEKEKEKYASKQVQLARELDALRNKAKAASEGKSLDDQATIKADLALAEKGARKKFEDKDGIADTKRGIDAQLEALKAGAVQKEEIARQEADTRASEFRRGTLNELQYIEQKRDADLAALASRRDAFQQELALLRGKKDSEKEQAALAGQIALSQQQAATIEIKARNDVADVTFKQARAAEAVYQAQRDESAADITASIIATAAARASGEKAVRDYGRSVKEANDFTQFEIGLMGSSDQARAVAIEQYRIQIELKKQLKAIDENTGFNDTGRAAARAAAEANAATAAAGASSKAYLDEWKKTSDTISSTLTDALMRGFEGGKGWEKNLKDTFKNLSKTLILKPLIEMPVKAAAAALAPLQKQFMDFIAMQILGHQQVATSAEIAAQTEVTAAAAAGMADAPVAVLNQAKGDPYTAFARMAAMAAAVAALGYAVSGGFSSASAAAPTNDGTGTVFGDASAKSASIENSIELLADASVTGLRYSAQMASSLKNIEAAMVGVTSLLLRGNGMGDLAASVPTGLFNTATSSFLGALDKWTAPGPLGEIMAGISTKAFGKKVSVQGGGIVGDKQSFGDIESLGFKGNYYADVQSKNKVFGITTSTKNSTVLSALDDEMARQFQQIFSGIGDTVQAAAGGLGLNLDVIDQRLREFVVDIGRIDLKDLSGTEIQEKLSAVFGAEADKIAGYVIPGFEAIQKVGEGYFETLVRASHQLEVTDLALGRMGLSLGKVGEGAKTADEVLAGILNGTPAPGVARAIKADELVQQFGGLDEFTTATDDFYRAFWSQADQTKNAFDLLTKSLAGVGFELPTSTAGFRDLVTGLDVTTEEGRQAFEVLTKVGPAFAQMQDDLMSAAGIGAEEISTLLRDQMLGRISGDEVGTKLGEIILDGIRNSIASTFANQITQAFTAQIIQPMLQSVLTGGIVSATVSQASIDNVVATATSAAKQLGVILKDPGFMSAMQGVQSAIGGITGALGSLASAASSAAAASNTLGSNYGSYVQNGVTYRTGNAADLAAEAITGTTTALNGAADAWRSVGEAITGEIRRIRGEIAGMDEAGQAFALTQFTLLTAQARAGDIEAAKLLPGASQSYLRLAEENAGSLLELRRAQGSVLSSLMQTQQSLGLTSSTSYSTPSVLVPSISAPSGAGGATLDAVVAELRELRAKVAAMGGALDDVATNTKVAATALDDAISQKKSFLVEVASS